MCVVELARDLKTTVGDTRVLFRAVDAPWTKPFPFAKDFGIDEAVYLSDGPFVYRTRSGQLLLLWSSFGPTGYAVGMARSATGDIFGPWTHDAEPLFERDGGHGMVFGSKEGKPLLVIHAPNLSPQERPMLIELTETEDDLLTCPQSSGGR
jgi:arabinan endo-1,5-alpha-L-arabinosidase